MTRRSTPVLFSPSKRKERRSRPSSRSWKAASCTPSSRPSSITTHRRADSARRDSWSTVKRCSTNIPTRRLMTLSTNSAAISAAAEPMPGFAARLRKSRGREPKPMPDYQWPDPANRTLIGKRSSRLDSPDKVSGQARYTYDIKRPEMLFGKMLRSPYAHCKVVSIDTSAAEKMPGVKAVEIVQKPGSTIHWAGDEVVAVAAVDEPTAEDAVRAIQVKYQKLSHLVLDNEPPQGAAVTQGPISWDDIGDMFDNQVPERQIISQLQEYGI